MDSVREAVSTLVDNIKNADTVEPLSNQCKKALEIINNLTKIQDDKDEQLSGRLQLLETLMKEICSMVQKVSILVQNKPLLNFTEACHHMLNIFMNVFIYCKQLGIEYTNPEVHPEVTTKLSLLFKLNYQNMKMFIEFLEVGIRKSGGCILRETNQLVQQSLCTLCSLGNVLFAIDIMPSVALWKCIRKLACIHKDFLINPFASFVIEKLFHIVNELINQAQSIQVQSNKDEKFYKVVKFYLNTLVLFLKECEGSVGKTELNHVMIVCESINTIVCDQHMCDKADAILNGFSQSLQNVIDSMLTLFTKKKEVILELLQGKTSDVSPTGIVTSSINLILESLSASNIQEEQLQYWIPSDYLQHSIFDVIFNFIEQSKDSIFDYKKQHGKEVKEGCLYEVLLTKSCMFISTVPSGGHYFNRLEEDLVKNIMSRDIYVSMFAMDLWCFVARWGAPELCFQHMVFIGKTIIQLSESSVNTRVAISNLSCLFKRLFWFLQDEQHKQLIEKFPPILANMVLWRYLPISHILADDDIVLCANVIQNIINIMEIKSYSCSKALINALHCVSNIVREKQLTMSTNLYEYIQHYINDFWLSLQTTDDVIERGEELIVVMLDSTSLMTSSSYIVSTLLKKILQTVSEISLNSDSYHLSCCNFLSSLKDVQFDDQIENDCLGYMATLYVRLLNHQNNFIQYSAMLSLKEFAEVTRYTNALAAFLPSSKKKRFALFLKKSIPSTQNDPDIHQKVFIVLNELSANHSESQDNNRNEALGEIKTVISTLSCDISKLHKLLKNQNEYPDWLKNELRHITSSWNNLTKGIQ